MLLCLIGFVFGAGVVVAGLVALQYLIIRGVASALEYRFDRYVFEGTRFPSSDFEQGRVVRRCLFPIKAHITYYNSQFQEVTEAATPGRYGAVIRIKLSWGFESVRYITLYRTPGMVFWFNGPMSVVADLPPNTGIDPAVVKNQGWLIGDMCKRGFGGEGEYPKLAILLAGLSEFSPTDPTATGREGVIAREMAWWYELRKRIGRLQKYAYLTELPVGYEDDPSKKWPVILYLHGGNQNGYNLEIVRNSGLPAVTNAWAKEGKSEKRPAAIIVSPQAPWYEDWNVKVLSDLLDEVVVKYRVDPDQISVTGISSGGIASWMLAEVYPERFAAIFPVGGDSDPNDADRLKNVPVWAFTGEDDDIVPSVNVLRMIEAIRRAGGNPHVTVYPKRDHEIQFDVYQTGELYQWVLAQRRGQPETLTPGLPPS